MQVDIIIDKRNLVALCFLLFLIGCWCGIGIENLKRIGEQKSDVIKIEGPVLVSPLTPKLEDNDEFPPDTPPVPFLLRDTLFEQDKDSLNTTYQTPMSLIID